MRITPENIEKLEEGQVFVFGSNEAGHHGAGAALLAFQRFGAQRRLGFGPTYRTFAIPTKDWTLQVLPLHVIQFYVTRFIAYVKDCESGFTFLVTQIGCGLAGYTPEEIAPLFKECVNIPAVHLPESFWNILNKE